MNRSLIFVLIFLITMLSGVACSKGGYKTVNPGTYLGNYYRSCPYNALCVGFTEPTLKLILVPGKFKATTIDPRFSGNCDGSFDEKGDSIYFGNGCVLSFDDDPSIHLQGGFEIRYSSPDSIFFRRSLDLNNPDFPIDGYYFKRVGAE